MGTGAEVGLARAAAVLAMALLASCGRGSTPEGIAGEFMDEYYVRADLAGARRVTDGLASQKIGNEEALVRGQTMGAAREGRTVAYSLASRAQEGDRHLFQYQVKVTLSGGSGTFARRVVLIVSPVGGGWRVTNFEESSS
jgi:hypothetical protein